MYKLGVMSAVIMMTLFLALKGVFIGSLILVMNLTFFAIKFGSYLKYDHQSAYVAPPSPNVWPHQKDVHLHIHNGNSAKSDYTIPYNTIANPGSGGWHESVSVPAESQPWSAYGAHGRTFDDNNFLVYPTNKRADRQIDRIDATERSVDYQTTTTNKPFIVTPQTRPLIVPPVTSYYYKQNRK